MSDSANAEALVRASSAHDQIADIMNDLPPEARWMAVELVTETAERAIGELAEAHGTSVLGARRAIASRIAWARRGKGGAP